MSIYSSILIALYIISAILVIVERVNRNNIGNLTTLFVSFCAILMAAFRPEVFPDVDVYEVIFDAAATGAFNDPEYWLVHSEPGFKIICFLIASTGVGVKGLFVFMSLLSYGLLIVTSRLAKVGISYLWFTYFSFYFIIRDLGQIRLAIASHLIVLVVLQSKVLTQLLLGGINILSFQAFAFMAQLSSFLAKIRPTIGIFVTLIIFSFLLGNRVTINETQLFISERLFDKWSTSYQLELGSVTLGASRNVILGFVAYWMLQSELNNRTYRLWIWMLFLSAVGYIFFMNIVVVGMRVGAYFGAILPLVFAYSLSTHKMKNQRFRIPFIVCIINFILNTYSNDWFWKP